MHRFYHHNRIVNHNSDGQYQSKKGEQVYSKPKELHKEESTYDSHRNGNGRYKCRSEILQENKNDQKNQYKSFQQRFFNLFDGGIKKIFRTENGECMYTLWKFGLRIFHYFFNSNEDIIGIGSRSLKYTQTRSPVTLNK